MTIMVSRQDNMSAFTHSLELDDAQTPARYFFLLCSITTTGLPFTFRFIATKPCFPVVTSSSQGLLHRQGTWQVPVSDQNRPRNNTHPGACTLMDGPKGVLSGILTRNTPWTLDSLMDSRSVCTIAAAEGNVLQSM